MNIYRNVSIRNSTDDKYPWFIPIDLNINTLCYYYCSAARSIYIKTLTSTLYISKYIQYVPIGYKHIET